GRRPDARSGPPPLTNSSAPASWTGRPSLGGGDPLRRVRGWLRLGRGGPVELASELIPPPELKSGVPFGRTEAGDGLWVAARLDGPTVEVSRPHDPGGGAVVHRLPRGG